MKSTKKIEFPELGYFGKIYVNDWPIGIFNQWCNSLIEDGSELRPEVLEAITQGSDLYKYNFDEFRQYLFKKMKCGGKICRATCGYDCATANNLTFLLCKKNEDRFCNFYQFEKYVLKHYFFKLNDAISKNLTKYKIGILIIMPDNIEDMFIKQETDLIIYQLNNQFYITDYSLIKGKRVFRHIKQYIDAVAIIVNSQYKNRIVHENYRTICTVLNRFTFVKIFLVKTADAASLDDGEIMNYYKDFFPKNELIIYDWLVKPEGFPDKIRSHLSMKTRLKIAICSQFIFKFPPEQ